MWWAGGESGDQGALARQVATLGSQQESQAAELKRQHEEHVKAIQELRAELDEVRRELREPKGKGGAAKSQGVEVGVKPEEKVSSTSMLESLCNQELWGYEQDQYDEMYAYLYKPVPGVVLSLLALILWVMTIIVEYRSTTEQALAILTLPTAKPGERCIEENEEGEVSIVGIRRSSRVLAMLCLALPRLGVMGMICWVGCRYLAQTPSLTDIVLNAVALAFVMDVDELLANLICTQKIRRTLESLQPLPCGTWRRSLIGTLQTKDLIRYALAVGVILFAYFMYLIPFHDNVAGAAAALCGGKYDFSYTGGTNADRTVTLQNTSGASGLCGEETLNSYFNTEYGGYSVNRSRTVTSARATPDLAPVRERVVLNFAFKGCPTGMILDPVLADREPIPERGCTPLPGPLRDMLPAQVEPGAAPDPPRCSSFQPSQPDTCSSLPPDGEACRWSWLAQDCEGSKPGWFHQSGCQGYDNYQGISDFETACPIWAAFGFQTTPRFNCRALDNCAPPEYDCIVVRGRLEVDYRNPSGWSANSAKAQIAGLLTNLTEPHLSRQAAITPVEVETSAVRRLSEPLPGGPTSPPRPAGTSREVFYYRMGPFKVTLVPETFFASNASEQIAQSISASFPTASVVQASFSHVSFLTLTDFQQEQEEAAQEASASTSDPDFDHGADQWSDHGAEHAFNDSNHSADYGQGGDEFNHSADYGHGGYEFNHSADYGHGEDEFNHSADNVSNHGEDHGFDEDDLV